MSAAPAAVDLCRRNDDGSVDVAPDGTAYIIGDTILRARYRNSMSVPELLEPGEVYELHIDLWATANVFRAGHRIRLDISSSNFPRFDRNTNTGGTIATEGLDVERREIRTLGERAIHRNGRLVLLVHGRDAEDSLDRRVHVELRVVRVVDAALGVWADRPEHARERDGRQGRVQEDEGERQRGGRERPDVLGARAEAPDRPRHEGGDAALHALPRGHPEALGRR